MMHGQKNIKLQSSVMASRTSDQSWSKGSVYATSKDVINIAMSMEGSGCALI